MLSEGLQDAPRGGGGVVGIHEGFWTMVPDFRQSSFCT